MDPASIKPVHTASNSPETQRARRLLDERRRRALNEEFSEKLKISPELAELSVLYLNPDNRPVSSQNLGKITQDVNEGLFECNGETIIFSRDGHEDGMGLLNDGQTRLWAAVRSGKPIVSWVVWGVPRDSRKTIDEGVKRTVARKLQMLDGETNAQVLAHASRLVIELYRRYRLQRRGEPSDTNILDFERAHSAELHRHLARVRAPATHFNLSLGVACATSYVLSEHSEDDCVRFWDLLNRIGRIEPIADELYDYHPLQALAELLDQHREDKKNRDGENLVIARLIKAWNLFRAGETAEVADVRHGRYDQYPRPR